MNRPGMTLGELVGLWLRQRKASLKVNSYAVYRHNVERYILPALGSVSLSELSRERLQSFIDELRRQGLSSKTIRDINAKLNSALNWAVEQGLLEHAGFCIKLSAASDASGGSAPRLLTAQQREQLDAFFCGEADPIKMGLYLCLNFGVQMGELCALRWSDLNLSEGFLTIDKRLQRISGENVPSGKKTTVSTLPQAVREVPLDRHAVSMLSRLSHTPDAYFLTGSRDKPMEPRALQYRLKRCLRQCGLPESIDFNMLRATFIAGKLAQGTDVCRVSRLIGAKRLTYIGDKYRDILDELAAAGTRASAETFAELTEAAQLQG